MSGWASRRESCFEFRDIHTVQNTYLGVTPILKPRCDDLALRQIFCAQGSASAKATMPKRSQNNTI